MDNPRAEIDIVIQPEMNGNEIVYSISSIQIPNVVTQGHTLEEAKLRLKEALELYFEECPQERLKLIKNIQKNAPLLSRMLL